jgi:cytochrome c oxidase subunit 1
MTTMDRTTDLPGDDGHHDEASYLHAQGSLHGDVLNWATTVDHKKIGVMYLFAVLFMFFLGGVAALAVRTSCSNPSAVEVNAAGRDRDRS